MTTSLEYVVSDHLSHPPSNALDKVVQLLIHG